MGHRIRIAAICAAALVVLAIGGAASAGASPRIVTATASTTVAGQSGTLGTVIARCPAGMAAISGGYETNLLFNPNGSGTAMLPYTSRRAGRRGWKVSAYNFGIGDPLTLTAKVFCGEGFGRLFTRKRRVTATAGVNNPKQRSLMAHCPRHTFALSGGFHFSVNGRATNPPDTPPVGFVLGSRAVARSWAITVARNGPGSSQVTAFAYCSAHRPMARHRSKILHQGSGSPQILSVRSRPCPSGSFAASGGFTARFPMGPGQQVALTTGSVLGGGKRWVMWGTPLAPTGRLNSVVYCLRPAQLDGGS